MTLTNIQRQFAKLSDDLSDCIQSWSESKPYRYINWWNDRESFWIADFITHHFGQHRAVCFFSSFGEHRKRFARYYKGAKIFYTGENLQEGGFAYKSYLYRDHRIKEMDLSLGFELRDEAKYYRFPLWITYLFQPTDTLADIRHKIAAFNDPHRRLGVGGLHTHSARTSQL